MRCKLLPSTVRQETALIRAFALAATLVLTLALGVQAARAAEPAPIVSYARQAKFDDVRDDLRAAIEARGLVIDYQSHVNRMLERTGKDVGSAQPLYVEAQSFVFCSALLSRRMMEADAANVALCPYVLTVYATVQQPDTVVVAYRRPWRPDGSPASQAALREVDALLDGLAREALGIK